jgi:hypothetical protein
MVDFRAVDCVTKQPIRLEPGYISDVSGGGGAEGRGPVAPALGFQGTLLKSGPSRALPS